MRSTYFNLEYRFYAHLKVMRLRDALGDSGAFALVVLWAWVAENHPDGVLTGISARDVELAVFWSGEPGALVAALLEIGCLDMDDSGTLVVHGWRDHNGQIVKKQECAGKGRLGKLASNYPEIYRECVAAGMDTIDKATYDRLVSEYKANRGGHGGRLNYVESLQKGEKLAKNGPTVRNSGDPCAYIKEGLEIKKDQEVEPAIALPAQSVETPKDEKDTVSLTQKPEEPKTVGAILTAGLPQREPTARSAEPVKKTDIDPKLTLEPGEIEEIHPTHIPEGMTADEVREIRRQRRLEPKYQALPDWLKVKDLRMMPFIEADERRMAQEKQEAQAAALTVETPPASKKPPLSLAKQAANRLPVEQSALLEGHAFNRTLNEARKLLHDFSGYRAPTTDQARRSEDEWLVTACQRLGRETCVIFSQASSWVRRKNIAVGSARAYLTTWTNRVALERRLIPAGKVWEKQKIGCAA